MKNLFLILLTILVVSCSTPTDSTIEEDFRSLSTQNLPTYLRLTNISITSGEGDFDNVYKHVKFYVTSDIETVVHKGWLSGKSVEKKQTFYAGELVFLYQKINGLWVLTSHTIQL